MRPPVEAFASRDAVVHRLGAVPAAARRQLVDHLLHLLQVALERVRAEDERRVLRRVVAVLDDRHPQVRREIGPGRQRSQGVGHLPAGGVDERAHAPRRVHDEGQVDLVQRVGHGATSSRNQ